MLLFKFINILHIFKLYLFTNIRFGFISYSSGQTLYDPWIYQFFNIIYTCFPIVWFGIYDIEISTKTLMNDQRYYVQGMIGKLFHTNRFWKWNIYGIIQGFFVFIVGFYCNNSSIEETGYTQELWSCGKYF